MNVADPAVTSAHAARPSAGAGQIVQGCSPCVLEEIHKPDVGLAIWHRSLPADLSAWLDRTLPSQLPDERLLVQPDNAEEEIQRVFDHAGTQSSASAAFLIADVSNLIARFANIAGVPLVDARLDVIHDNACWKFHRDFVPLRMLVTYIGPSTQFVKPGDEVRALRQQKRYAGALGTVPRFAAALFKGATARKGAGVVHRSPPIAGTGASRFLLCLNIPQDLQD